MLIISSPTAFVLKAIRDEIITIETGPERKCHEK